MVESTGTKALRPRDISASLKGLNNEVGASPRTIEQITETNCCQFATVVFHPGAHLRGSLHSHCAEGIVIASVAKQGSGPPKVPGPLLETNAFGLLKVGGETLTGSSSG